MLLGQTKPTGLKPSTRKRKTSGSEPTVEVHKMARSKVTKGDELKFKNLVEKTLVPSYQRTQKAGLKLTDRQMRMVERAGAKKGSKANLI